MSTSTSSRWGPKEGDACADLAGATFVEGKQHPAGPLRFVDGEAVLDGIAKGGPVDQLDRLLGIAQAAHMFAGVGHEQAEGIGAPLHDDAAGMSELLVPEPELGWGGLAGLDALEEPIALLQDALVSLHGAQVPAVDLRGHHVEVAAAKDGRAANNLDVEGGEEHGGQFTDSIGGALGKTVHADALARSLALTTPANHGDLEIETSGGALDLGLEASDGGIRNRGRRAARDRSRCWRGSNAGWRAGRRPQGGCSSPWAFSPTKMLRPRPRVRSTCA